MQQVLVRIFGTEMFQETVGLMAGIIIEQGCNTLVCIRVCSVPVSSIATRGISCGQPVAAARITFITDKLVEGCQKHVGSGLIIRRSILSLAVQIGTFPQTQL